MTVAERDETEAAGNQSAQRARVYVLLNVLEGHSRRVASILRGKPGVIMVDVLEEQPGVMMVVEARHRLRLAELTIQALAPVEALIEVMHLMPIEEQALSLTPGGLAVRGVRNGAVSGIRRARDQYDRRRPTGVRSPDTVQAVGVHDPDVAAPGRGAWR